MKTEVVPRQAEALAVSHRRPLKLWIELVALAAILSLGAYLRFARLEFAQFRPDDAALLNIARGLAERPQILSSGIPSSAAGFANGPFQAYLLLPATLLSSDPLPAYYLVAGLNVAGIALLWGFARSYWGQHVALIAALLYAVNPWAVVFSRRLWGNDLTAPFVVLVIWSLCNLARLGRRRDSILPWIWLAVLIQLYVGALVFVAVFFIGLFLARRKLRWPYMIAGLAAFLALSGPYLFGVLFMQLDSIALPMGSLGGRADIDFTSLLFMLHAVSAEGYQAFANHAAVIVDASLGLPKVISMASEALLAIGLTLAIAKAAREWLRPSAAAPYALAAATVLLPALLLIRHSATVYIYYMLVGFPAHFLLLALGLRQVWRWVGTAVAYCARRRGNDAPALVLHPGSRAFVGFAFVPAAIVAMHLTLAQVFFQKIQEFWPKSDYGIPMGHSLDVVRQTKRLAREHGISRVLIGGADSQEGVLLNGLAPEVANLTFFDSDRTFVVPAESSDKVLYVVPTTDDPIGRELAEALGDSQVASVSLPGYGWQYGFFVLDENGLGRAARLPSAIPPRPRDARLSDHLQLLGYALPNEIVQGEPLRVALYLKVLRRPTENVSLFTHVIGNRGSLWAQQDGLSYPIDQWQPGDLLVEKHALSLPAGTPPVDIQVEAGAYYASSGERLPVAVEGGPRDDRLRLGSARINRPSLPPAPPVTDLDIRYGDSIALRGYRLEGQPVVGQQMRLTLYWQSLAPTGDDYTVFVHLAGPDGKPVAQADGPPALGMLTTSLWLPGDFLRDVHEIAIPAGVQPGRYRLLVGLYRPPDGPRLPAKNSEASPIDRLTGLLAQRGLWPAAPRVAGDVVELIQQDVRAPEKR